MYVYGQHFIILVDLWKQEARSDFISFKIGNQSYELAIYTLTYTIVRVKVLGPSSPASR